MEMKQSDYVLGHTAREQLRLIRQAQVLAPITERFLRDAGIVLGMRVLDIGCGMGDVTMLIAQLVGPTGRIVSIDLDHASIETARRRASAAGVDNAIFRRADISTFTDREPFDAIVGRLVLEFLPDRGSFNTTQYRWRSRPPPALDANANARMGSVRELAQNTRLLTLGHAHHRF